MLSRDFAALLGELPAELPLSFILEKHDKQTSNRWWFSQRTHLVGYIARRAYEDGWTTLEVEGVWGGITRPEARFWVIEALGLIGDEGPEVIKDLKRLPFGNSSKTKYEAHRNYLEARYPLKSIVAAAETQYQHLITADRIKFRQESRRR
ncbi:hypothetical protein [Mobiluncus curtisii]|uniref:hypothetical protein n=1 Tax=Mobiluncus curtisii TaxID=2051 RepID=UPI0001E094FB|nr:hypothetical protein [Mobiluncus curtisii]EFL94110.1 hypothetical protein HMPREF0574_0617 [Mobiluncus curtisii subsp. curtisii ATCC 35241]QQT12917.1 hypothetical protein I6I84_07305 [Mobiluncus curtisii]